MDRVDRIMRLTSLVFILLVLMSCGDASTSEEKAFVFPVALDTTYDDLPHRKEKWLNWASYYPLYLGPRRDTIYADQRLKYSQGKPHPRNGGSLAAQGCFIDWLDARNFRTPDSSDIAIYVDTTRIIANEGDHFDQPEPAFKAFPVYLVNLGSDTIQVGYGTFLRMTMEGRTETGQWRPIEDPFTYMCGNGVGTIVLPPGFIALTSAPIYQGDLPTECRIKFGPLTSSTFYASIDRRQYESKYDKNGNYKEE